MFAASCTRADGGPSQPDPPRVCSTIGCVDGLTVALQARAWPAGSYEFAVRLDQRTVTCTGTLPLPACGTPSLTCDGPGVAIGESGCALPPEQHGFGEIHVDTTPDEVEVRLSFEGKARVTYTSKPVYRTTQPNGPECEPTCTNGGITMEVPALHSASAKPKPVPAPKTVEATTACLAPAPRIPAGVADQDRACLESLVAARARFGFIEPPEPGAKPCAIEEIDDDGIIRDRGRVARFDDRSHVFVFDSTDEYGQRTVVTHTHSLDAKGRVQESVRLWDNYLEGEATPDCSNPTTTRHVRNGKGWPKRTKKVIETCEGVDAGTITTQRAFAPQTGFVRANLKIVDRGSKVRATGWWLPDPADPIAFGTTDEHDDVECTLRVVGCDGVELGTLEGGDGPSATRYRWRCETD